MLDNNFEGNDIIIHKIKGKQRGKSFIISFG